MMCERQNPDLNILAKFNILESKNPDFKIVHDQNPEFKILTDFNILKILNAKFWLHFNILISQTPEFKILES